MKRIAVCLLVAACTKEPPPLVATAASASASSTGIEVGKPAPDFSVTSADGTKLALAELKGKYVVLYFYPKDETPGCTTEACSFRDSFEAMSKKAVLIGVSADDDASHKAFADHHKLPFHLVSDPKNDLGKKFGVPFGEKFPNVHARQTFVIDPQGNVQNIHRTVDVTKHASEVLSELH